MITLNSIFHPSTIVRPTNPATGPQAVQKRGPNAEGQPEAQGRGIVQQAGAILSRGAALHFGGLSLALNDLKGMVQTLVQRIQHGDLNASLNTDDAVLTLKKLILDRLTNNGKLPDVKGIIEMKPSSLINNAADSEDFTAFSASYLSLDIRIELQNVTAMQGRAQVTENNIAIHLEYFSYSGISGGDYRSHGLNLLAPNIVDTGQYLIGFKNEMSVEIYEKFSRLSTVVWGDPHVDLSDVEGPANGEFSDLKKSDFLTVFSLQDGTKILFTAPDVGLIQSVDILKNGQRMHAVGVGGNAGSAAVAVFSRLKNMDDIQPLLQQADWVMAGGDGNDWYGPDGKLVWGDALQA